MAEMNSTITLKFEEQTLTLPSRLVTRMLEKIFDEQPVRIQTSTPANLPGIGDAYEDGIYAGVTLEASLRQALVLLPGDEELNWKDAKTWAERRRGALPSRLDALILSQNLPGEFRKEAYWTDTQHAAGSDSAWCQDFLTGGQSYGTVYYELRARAVRRIAI